MPRPPLGQAALPAVERAALLLDLDGTLLDIAATPEGVVVPEGLVGALVGWRQRLGGALAVVSGRPIGQIDALLPDVLTAVAGEHGGAMRLRPGGAVERAALPAVPGDWVAAAEAAVAWYPGALVERKALGFAVHYRGAPGAGAALGDAVRRMVAGDGRFQVLSALMAWEVRPVGADKGSAVERLMGCAPFLGRLPVFVGDDVTDEDGIAAAVRLGGAGLRVADSFGDAAGVRAWLS